MNFNAIVFFNAGTALPSENDIVTALVAADYDAYVSNYVRNSQPIGTSIFFDTLRATLVVAVPLI